MKAELECVPNVSEGRRPEVIARLAAAVSVEGVELLDVAPDPDHNRTVLTLAGSEAGLHQALLGLYQAALEAIDLTVQAGAHPRVGAVDVVPFVPLGATPMARAVAAAERLAGEVARRFDLPVFLYEEAARRPERRSLPEIRRGGPIRLAERMKNESWQPDFGPARLHPTAGATVVGARFFLIAFNVLLETAEVEVAKRIAKAVRASSGGLAAVRAIGVYLPSRRRAQVSLNLLDYRQTSLLRMVEAVREQAEREGTRIFASELIGLAPAAALLGPLADLLELPELPASRLLEHRLLLAEGGEDPAGHAVERTGGHGDNHVSRR
ncbi:MAG TPA: glutamate formimidoyltransferase [Thermoanaerobaculia bacterium]|nr:glutamate formimidoyltransferase [Thermoanaerobaculia bacterium]